MPKTRRALIAFAVGVGLSLGAIPVAQAKNSPAKDACKIDHEPHKNQGQCIKAAKQPTTLPS